MMMRNAACIPVAGLTAYESLVKCGLDSNQSSNLLVIGGAGGVGSWIITLAKAMHPKAQVIATASSKSQQDWCTSLGADQIMKHNEIEQHLKGGQDGSVDAIICLTEPTAELFSTVSNVIKPYGTVCLVVAGKSIESINLSFCFFKCVNVVTETVFSSIRSNYTKIVPSQELDYILDLLSRGIIRAPLSPDITDGGMFSESFNDAIKPNGVLKGLSQVHGRRGNFVMKVIE
jgi:NADPH:quinone reductase-like Zn-dependent oxidoreductase